MKARLSKMKKAAGFPGGLLSRKSFKIDYL
jgi:hypothetical protein